MSPSYLPVYFFTNYLRISFKYNTTFQTRKTFTGKELDPETNLYYFGSRYYDSRLGRFISLDPASKYTASLLLFFDPQRFNTYSYANNNPVKYTDPDGNQAEKAWYEKAWDALMESLDAAPITGDVSDVYVASTGKTLFSQTELSKEDLDLTIAMATVPIVTGGQARQAKKIEKIINETQKELKKVGPEAVQIGKKMAKQGGKIYERIDKVPEEVLKNSKKIAGEGVIQGRKNIVFRDAEKLAKQHGGETKDWFKMTSVDVFTDSKKGRYQIHYDMNAKTGEAVNAKRKYIDLK